MLKRLQIVAVREAKGTSGTLVLPLREVPLITAFTVASVEIVDTTMPLTCSCECAHSALHSFISSPPTYSVYCAMKWIGA